MPTARPAPVRVTEVKLRGVPSPLHRAGGAVYFYPKPLFRLTRVVQGPLERDLLRVAWTTDGPATVRVRIDDAAGASVRVFPARTSERGAWMTIDWDGTDEEGRLVAPGVYRVVVEGAPAPPGAQISVAGNAAEVRVEPPVRPEFGAESPRVANGAGPGDTRLFVAIRGPAPLRVSAYVLRYDEAEDRFEPLTHILRDHVLQEGTLAWDAAGIAPGLYYLLVVSSPDVDEPLPELIGQFGAGLPVRATLRPIEVTGALSAAKTFIDTVLAPALAEVGGNAAKGGEPSTPAPAPANDEGVTP
ncbi:MAG: hypothetical protein KC466_08910 [Myxococcales bacterium]|nr:hypothetical protein [Myxococcales bacterium]